MTSISVLEKFGAVRRGLNRLAVQKLRPLKIGPKQMLVIWWVAKRQEPSITDLAEACDSDLAAVSRMISSLVKSGWLTRNQHPEDARQTVIRLGPKAKRRMPELEKIRDEVADAMTKALIRAESEALLQILSKIDDSVNGTSTGG